MRSTPKPFWETKSLDEMTQQEWESLCDGCARCCLHKLELEGTGEVYYTNVVCRLLDPERCCCRRYDERQRLVPDCLQLTPSKARRLKWLPRTCAYRRLAEGRELKWWHPLVSNDPETVHDADISIRGKVVNELSVHPNQLESPSVIWKF